MKKIILTICLLLLTACENQRIVNGFVVTSINEDFCIEDECVYSIKGTISLRKVEYKADNTMIGYIEVGQKLKFRYNENGFIDEFIVN